MSKFKTGSVEWCEEQRFKEWCKAQTRPPKDTANSSGGMVEIVAKAIAGAYEGRSDTYADNYWHNWTDEAKAAIKAMKQPNRSIIDFMSEIRDGEHPNCSNKEIWEDLIDEALK